MLDAIALEAASRDSQKFVVYVQLIYPDDSSSHSSQVFQTAAKVQFTRFVNVRSQWSIGNVRDCGVRDTLTAVPRSTQPSTLREMVK